MHWNYLRVRGEYAVNTTEAWKKWELPPRARRIPSLRFSSCTMMGTTSACAENTAAAASCAARLWNYLRVRGEYASMPSRRASLGELPPRARRILPNNAWTGLRIGTTSACAENTTTARKRLPKTRNYLRVRGEYLEIASHAVMIQELPPRARRIRAVTIGRGISKGTTSACAENT